MKQFHNLKIYVSTLLLLAATAACTDEEQSNMTLAPAEENITFLGTVAEEKEIATRADNHTVINSEADKYGKMDFYIYQQIDEDEPTTRIYQASSGDQGRLVTKEGNEPLKWQSPEATHTFYAWTQPVPDDDTKEYTGGVKMDEKKEGEDYSTTGTVTFGTQAETGLEHFVVTKRGPLTYDETNQYVGLHFYHPIGKIVIDNIRHYFREDVETSPSEPVTECTITFPNLYTSATFNAIANMSEDDTPYEAVLTAKQEESTGIVWEWQENKKETYLYVLPFSFYEEGKEYYEQPGFFRIDAEVSEGGSKLKQSYTGTLAGISPTITGVKGNQELHISMQIADGNVTGINSFIDEWTDDDLKDIYQHRIPGVYTQEDAEALLRGLLSDPINIPPYLIDEENGTKTIRFFTHIDWSSLLEEVENITIPKGYILDGQGYNLILPKGISLYGTKENEEKGNIKNLYVNGEEYKFVEKTEPEQPDKDTEDEEETTGGKEDKRPTDPETPGTDTESSTENNANA